MNPLLIKALLINASAQLAAGVVSNLPDQLGVDPDVKDPNTQAENLMAFNCAHTFYDGFIRALDPKTGWRTPDGPLSGDVPSLAVGSPVVSAITDIAAKLGIAPQFMGVIEKLISSIPTPTHTAGPVLSPAESVGAK